MRKINWKEIKEQFEKEMALKLRGLPNHRRVPENLREFRHLISHQLPETAPLQLFKLLINLLLEEKSINLLKIKEKYLNPQLRTEKQILSEFNNKFDKLRKSARKWVKANLSEEQLVLLWKTHKTWLPRRHAIYKNKKVSFQTIAAETLARYVLIKTSSRLRKASPRKKKIYSYQLGIDLKSGKEKEIFKWFLACLLFGKPIQQEVAKRTYFEFQKEDLLTPEKILEAGWDKLVEVLDRGHYVRYDFSTATKLLEICQELKTKYESLTNLLRQSKNQRELEKKLLEFRGIGPVTVRIFLRDLAKIAKNFLLVVK
ncbi:MAG: hypothetical protein ACOZBZ_00255 [Patescibacteria group bacterium]